MIPWEHLGTATVPGGTDEMNLYRRGEEYSLRVGMCELMNSRRFGSEEVLAELAAERLRGRTEPRILIGGLGLGMTARAALDAFGEGCRIDVAELIPEVVQWNREFMGHLAGHPLDDPRCHVLQKDIAKVLRHVRGKYDAILQDVDNGPEGLAIPRNRWLYGPTGLQATRRCLKPGGVLVVWSVGSSPAFTERLRREKFEVEEVPVKARRTKGSRHHLWVARR
ncbi:MAG: spermidine synthase [Planctomycetes bacterium]|nr:spermidine synthase [Planctomycetota bacterium]